MSSEELVKIATLTANVANLTTNLDAFIKQKEGTDKEQFGRLEEHTERLATVETKVETRDKEVFTRLKKIDECLVKLKNNKASINPGPAAAATAPEKKKGFLETLLHIRKIWLLLIPFCGIVIKYTITFFKGVVSVLEQLEAMGITP